MNDRHLILAGSLNMFLAVTAGAFGAHGLKKILTPDLLAIWQTAVQYHMLHGIALLLIALLMPRLGAATLSLAGMLMLAGIALFSGSLYALALSGVRILGAVTPLGGVAFLAGWLLLAWAAYKAA